MKLTDDLDLGRCAVNLVAELAANEFTSCQLALSVEPFLVDVVAETRRKVRWKPDGCVERIAVLLPEVESRRVAVKIVLDECLQVILGDPASEFMCCPNAFQNGKPPWAMRCPALASISSCCCLMFSTATKVWSILSSSCSGVRS